MNELLCEPFYQYFSYGRPGFCHLVAYQDDYSIIVIVTELESNDGVSITNAIEAIETAIENQFSYLDKQIFLIEHYTNDNRDDYDLVLTNPTRWKRLNEDEIYNPYKLAEAVCSMQL